jgi:hypothetical protein
MSKYRARARTVRMLRPSPGDFERAVQGDEPGRSGRPVCRLCARSGSTVRSKGWSVIVSPL